MIDMSWFYICKLEQTLSLGVGIDNYHKNKQALVHHKPFIMVQMFSHNQNSDNITITGLCLATASQGYVLPVWASQALS